MKKSWFLLLLLCIFVSCKTQKSDIYGKYYKVNKKYPPRCVVSLTINADSTFSLLISMQDYQPCCEGRWHMTDSNHIEMICNEVSDISEMLTNAYMTKREHVIEIVDKNRIKYGSSILKRKR